jgi:hypothetical protein
VSEEYIDPVHLRAIQNLLLAHGFGKRATILPVDGCPGGYSLPKYGISVFFQSGDQSDLFTVARTQDLEPGEDVPTELPKVQLTKRPTRNASIARWIKAPPR